MTVSQALIAVFILGIGVGFMAGVVAPFQLVNPAAVNPSRPSPGAGSSQGQDNRINLKSSMLENEPSMGSKDAPLTIVEYSDYGCPWCAEWAGFEAIPDNAGGITGTIDNRETLQKIKKNYVKTGKARFVLKDYPVKSLHPNAPEAHKAANCILEQSESLYWDFHDMLFRKREQWKQSSNPLKQFRNYTRSVGANLTEFTTCYRNSDNSEVRQDKRRIEKLVGRLGTPTILIGNTEDGFVMVQGAQPYPTLKNIIEAELQKAKK